MSNEISFSLSVGGFGKDSKLMEVVEHIYNCSIFGVDIDIENLCGANGYTYIKAHGRAPWFSSLEWFCDMIEEEHLSADLYMSDSIGNIATEIQWRKGYCVYQKDRELYYYDDSEDRDDPYCNYKEDDEKAILLLKGKEVPPLKEFLKKNYKAENEKYMKRLFATLNNKVDEDKAEDLPF